MSRTRRKHIASRPGLRALRAAFTFAPHPFPTNAATPLKRASKRYNISFHESQPATIHSSSPRDCRVPAHPAGSCYQGLFSRLRQLGNLPCLFGDSRRHRDESIIHPPNATRRDPLPDRPPTSDGWPYRRPHDDLMCGVWRHRHLPKILSITAFDMCHKPVPKDAPKIARRFNAVSALPPILLSPGWRGPG